MSCSPDLQKRIFTIITVIITESGKDCQKIRGWGEPMIILKNVRRYERQTAIHPGKAPVYCE
jgi:hypothetical protein